VPIDYYFPNNQLMKRHRRCCCHKLPLHGLLPQTANRSGTKTC